MKIDPSSKRILDLDTIEYIINYIESIGKNEEDIIKKILDKFNDTIKTEKNAGSGLLKDYSNISEIRLESTICDENIYFIPAENKIFYFFGDIHGDFNSLIGGLKGIIKQFSSEKKNNNNEEDEPIIVFMGDYIDRGYKSLQVLLFVLVLKYVFPKNIYLLKGNHDVLKLDSEKKRLMADCMFDLSDETYFANFLHHNGYSFNIQKKFKEVLDIIPTMLLIKHEYLNVFAGHGAIPKPDVEVEKDMYHHINNLGCFNENEELLDQIRWGDPEAKYDVFMDGSRRFAFAQIHFDQFIEKFDIDLVVRAHSEHFVGYKWFYDKRLISVFSTGGGEENEDAYYIDVTPDILKIDYKKSKKILYDIDVFSKKLITEENEEYNFEPIKLDISVALFSRNENFVREIVNFNFFDNIYRVIGKNIYNDGIPKILIYHSEHYDLLNNVKFQDYDSFYEENREELVFNPNAYKLWEGVDYLFINQDQSKFNIIIVITDEDVRTTKINRKPNHLIDKLKVLFNNIANSKTGLLIVGLDKTDYDQIINQNIWFSEAGVSGLRNKDRCKYNNAITIVGNEVKQMIKKLEANKNKYKIEPAFENSSDLEESIIVW